MPNIDLHAVSDANRTVALVPVQVESSSGVGEGEDPASTPENKRTPVTSVFSTPVMTFSASAVTTLKISSQPCEAWVILTRGH